MYQVAAVQTFPKISRRLFIYALHCLHLYSCISGAKSHTHFEKFIFVRAGGGLLEVNLMVCVEVLSAMIFPPALTVMPVSLANATVAPGVS